MKINEGKFNMVYEIDEVLRLENVAQERARSVDQLVQMVSSSSNQAHLEDLRGQLLVIARADHLPGCHLSINKYRNTIPQGLSDCNCGHREASNGAAHAWRAIQHLSR